MKEKSDKSHKMMLVSGRATNEKERKKQNQYTPSFMDKFLQAAHAYNKNLSGFSLCEYSAFAAGELFDCEYLRKIIWRIQCVRSIFGIEENTEQTQSLSSAIRISLEVKDLLCRMD